ncbi:MAG: hypothetical protein COT74_13505 [Bdellovibrionales bacterium CG10_big_fil_rev_8_21_14_0_10_45_34]|nr:MAG: hypothetical protein COT74_13505 [Bdellovibrionales bacterium CG10_big_fil_rev_8_21_14_0_10_45_34]
MIGIVFFAMLASVELSAETASTNPSDIPTNRIRHCEVFGSPTRLQPSRQVIPIADELESAMTRNALPDSHAQVGAPLGILDSHIRSTIASLLLRRTELNKLVELGLPSNSNSNSSSDDPDLHSSSAAFVMPPVDIFTPDQYEVRFLQDTLLDRQRRDRLSDRKTSDRKELSFGVLLTSLRRRFEKLPTEEQVKIVTELNSITAKLELEELQASKLNQLFQINHEIDGVLDRILPPGQMLSPSHSDLLPIVMNIGSLVLKGAPFSKDKNTNANWISAWGSLPVWYSDTIERCIDDNPPSNKSQVRLTWGAEMAAAGVAQVLAAFAFAGVNDYAKYERVNATYLEDLSISLASSTVGGFSNAYLLTWFMDPKRPKSFVFRYGIFQTYAAAFTAFEAGIITLRRSLQRGGFENLNEDDYQEILGRVAFSTAFAAAGGLFRPTFIEPLLGKISCAAGLAQKPIYRIGSFLLQFGWGASMAFAYKSGRDWAAGISVEKEPRHKYQPPSGN